MHRFSQRAFPQQNLVHPLDEALFYGFLGFSDALQASLIEFLKQLLSKVVSVSKELTEPALRHFGDRFALISVSRGELQGKQGELLVDDQMQFEAKLSSGRAFKNVYFTKNYAQI